MKRTLSLALVFCMLISLLPVFSLTASAEAATKEYVITKDTTFAYAATPVREPSVSGGYFKAKLRYDTYDAVNYAGGAHYIAFPIEAPNAGEYELQIKAYENLSTSAVPAVYLIHESELLEKNEAKGRNYVGTKAQYAGAYSDDIRSPLGYYDFSTASTTEYTSIKTATGSTPTVTIDKTGTYYIVICPETHSRAINPKVRNTKDSNAVVDTLANGYLNADGTVKDKTVQPANSVYQQDIAISGFRFKVPSGELEERVFTYNFNYSSHGATGRVSRVDLANYSLETIVPSKSDPWELNGWRYAYNGYFWEDHVRWNAQARRADGALITAFTIKAQEGKYVPSIEYNTLPSGYIADIYLVKKEATDTYSQFNSNGNDVNLLNRITALNGKGKIGTIDFYTSEAGIGTTTFDEITLDETGEYLLLFHATGTNPEMIRESYIDGQIRKLTLTPPSMVPKDELQSFSASIAPRTVEVGGTAAITAKATYSLSGDKVVADGITFKSSAESVVTVSADGTVTAVAEGKATITVTLDGTEFSDSVELEVLPYDAGNAGVIREYITTWDALSLTKLPSTSDSNLYSNEPYTRSGTILMNTSLMNRNAVSYLNSAGETVPEYGLMNSFVGEMGRYYKLPSFGISGASDSNNYDFQMGAEMLYTMMCSIYGRQNFVHDNGYMGLGQMGALQAIIAANELLSYTARYVQGIRFTEEALAFDAIKAVGQGGNYLERRETFKLFRKEFWMPEFLNRRRHMGKPTPSIPEQLTAKAKAMIEEECPTYISAELEAEFDRLIAEHEAHYNA